VQRNSWYQVTIQRWAREYGEERSFKGKKEIISRIYTYLVEKGVRFLTQEELGPGDEQTVYAEVTEKYRVMQRIQRSLQDHYRLHVSTNTIQSPSSLATSSLDELCGYTGSFGALENDSRKQVQRTTQVTENEAANDAHIPSPTLLLWQSSSAYSIFDSTMKGSFHADEKFEINTSHPPPGGDHVQPGHGRTFDGSTSVLAGTWPEIHLPRKESEAIDNVSQITDCSSRPETRGGLIFGDPTAARGGFRMAPVLLAPSANVGFPPGISRGGHRTNHPARVPESWNVHLTPGSVHRAEASIGDSSVCEVAGMILPTIVTTDSEEAEDGSEQNGGQGRFQDAFRSFWAPAEVGASACDEGSHVLEDSTSPGRNETSRPPKGLYQQALDEHGAISAIQAEIRCVREKNTALEGELHAMRVRVAIAEEKVYRLEQSGHHFQRGPLLGRADDRSGIEWRSGWDV
jgi:hypothetical protein